MAAFCSRGEKGGREEEIFSLQSNFFRILCELVRREEKSFFYHAFL
jgi:hypothetical protein